MLAEISDKMPTVAGCTTAGCILAIVALGLGMLRRPLVLALLPVVGFGNYMLWGLLADDGFLQQMVRETSWSYVGGWFVGWNAPFLVVCGILMLLPRRFSTPEHCAHCGYSLHGLPEPRCPECGTPFSWRGDHDATRAA